MLANISIGKQQIDLFDDLFTIPELRKSIAPQMSFDDGLTYFNAPTIDLSIYDHIIVSMSGGKDSIAAFTFTHWQASTTSMALRNSPMFTVLSLTPELPRVQE